SPSPPPGWHGPRPARAGGRARERSASRPPGPRAARTRSRPRRRRRSRPRSRPPPGAPAGARSRASPPRSWWRRAIAPRRAGWCRRSVPGPSSVSFTPARPGKHLGPRTARPVAPETKKPRGGWSRPWHPPRKVRVLPYTPPRAAGGRLSSRPRASRRSVDFSNITPSVSGPVRACQARPRARAGTRRPQRAAGQTAREGQERPGERIAPHPEEEHHLRRAHGQKEEDDQPEQDRERMAVVEADLLERVVPDLAHHEPRHREDDEQHHDVLAGLALAAEPEPEQHGGGDH